MKTPILSTDRLLLRPFRMSDLESVYNGWETDPDVAMYMTWTSHNDINKTKDFLEMELNKIDANDWYRWAIVNKENDELIGTCIIYNSESSDCYEVAYNLGKKHWGNGYITEAMSEAIAFAKNNSLTNKLLGGCAKINKASEQVLKKLGFKYVKDAPYDCGGKMMLDGVIYELQL